MNKLIDYMKENKIKEIKGIKEIKENVITKTESSKSRLVALILLLIPIFGMGMHRFYVRKYMTGLIWMLTGGFFLIGILIDLIKILQGNFQDKDDKYLLQWLNKD